MRLAPGLEPETFLLTGKTLQVKGWKQSSERSLGFMCP